VLLSTDAQGVMGTDISREYGFAADLLDRFRSGEIALTVPDPADPGQMTRVYFDDLPSDVQARFDIRHLEGAAQDYAAEAMQRGHSGPAPDPASGTPTPDTPAPRPDSPTADTVPAPDAPAPDLTTGPAVTPRPDTDPAPAADVADSTRPASPGDRAYLEQVARFRGTSLDEVVQFYTNMATLGIDHNALIEQAMARHPGLTRAEADAIFGYTTKLFYRDLNRDLNSGGSDEAQSLSGLIQSGLESMPPAADVQYRGLRLNSPEEIAAFDAEYQMDAVVETRSFWSTGPDPGNAYAGGRTLIIHTRSAREISDLAFGVHFHDRVGKTTYTSEGIIPPGVRFRVVDVDASTGTVTLEEI
jgi:hypothetical protein